MRQPAAYQPQAPLEGVETLNRLLQVIDEFRKIDPRVPLQQVMILLAVAIEEYGAGAEGPPKMQDVGNRVGMGGTNVSRNIGTLAGFDEHGRERPVMVQTYEDPVDRRTKRATLTRTGKNFLSKIVNILERTQHGSLTTR